MQIQLKIACLTAQIGDHTQRRYLADRTNGRAIGTVLRPSSVVCNVKYCG